jgi:hypothetical protein
MGHGSGLSADVVWQGAPGAFGFLVHGAGFDGPERLGHGLAYHRADVTIEVCYYHVDGCDPEIATSLVAVSRDQARSRRASLETVYTACGLGPRGDVPGSAQTRRAALASIGRHADAVRKILPFLTPDRIGVLLDSGV